MEKKHKAEYEQTTISSHSRQVSQAEEMKNNIPAAQRMQCSSGRRSSSIVALSGNNPCCCSMHCSGKERMYTILPEDEHALLRSEWMVTPLPVAGIARSLCMCAVLTSSDRRCKATGPEVRATMTSAWWHVAAQGGQRPHGERRYGAETTNNCSRKETRE
jgi:hypothetical protein